LRTPPFGVFLAAWLGRERVTIHNLVEERSHMMNMRSIALLTLAGVLAASGSAYADFSGQPILGPLGLGSSVAGDTTGAADDNDGITSGMHIFDIWLGPDDVWQLDWAGGDMELEMTYDSSIDLDLFLYTPGSLDDSGLFSMLNSGLENISYPAAPAGTYYINVDGVLPTDAGPYTLSVTPEPGTLALLGLGIVFLVRRSGRNA
jgi:hypothetical protein